MVRRANHLEQSFGCRRPGPGNAAHESLVLVALWVCRSEIVVSATSSVVVCKVPGRTTGDPPRGHNAYLLLTLATVLLDDVNVFRPLRQVRYAVPVQRTQMANVDLVEPKE